MIGKRGKTGDQSGVERKWGGELGGWEGAAVMNEMNREYTGVRPPLGGPFFFHSLFFLILWILPPLPAPPAAAGPRRTAHPLFLCRLLLPSPLFRASPIAYGSSLARGRIGPAAASLHHSNVGPSLVHDLHHSSRQCRILDLLNEAKNQTHILT